MISLDYLQEHFPAQWIGVEPSSGMVKQYNGKEQLLVGRGESLPFPDNFADVCVSLTAIQNFDDSNAGIIEISRVVKDKAPIIISCLKKSSQLGKIAEELAEILVVLEAVEEEKDIIFVCLNKKTVFSEE